MKIVIMNTVPYGSTGRIARNISKKVQDQGNEVYLVNGWTKNKWKSKASNEIIATSFISKLINLCLSRFSGLDGCFSVIATWRIISKLKQIDPDVVHLHIMHDYFLNISLLFEYFKKKNVRVIWTFHDCWAFTGGCPHFSISECKQWRSGCENCIAKKQYDRIRINAPKKMWRIKRNLSEYDNVWITTPSSWLAEKVSMSIWHEKECAVIKNGLNLDVFHHLESDFKERIHCEDKYLVLGVAFDWGQRKGLDVFNELADLLPFNYQIVLVGTNKMIDSQVNNKIITIHKTSNQEDLVKIYSACNVFVNPTREEVFGMVNIEAIACGTPVITFNTDGAPEGVNSECGVVVDEKNAKGLLPVIQDVCESRSFDYSRMMRWVKNFDEQECYNDYLELYRKIVN